MNQPTYTRTQAEHVLGINSRTAFHSLRKRYPQAFIIIHQGRGREGTLYNKAALDKFVQWRNSSKEFKP